MKLYLELLRGRGVARIVASQLIARFPFGMLSIAFLIHIERVHNSYAIAGFVIGALSAGQALVGPITSRLMSNFGMRNLIAWTIAICATSLTLMALFPQNVFLLIALALVAGSSMPPIQPAVRTIYPKLVPSKFLTPLFSLDASAQEIIWVMGPVITTFLAIQVGGVPAVLAAVAFLVFGGLWFITSPEVGQVRIPKSKRKLGSVLTNHTVFISTVVGFVLVATFGSVEAGIIAIFADKNFEAGWILAIFALASLIGGLAWGHKEIAPWSMTRRISLVLLGILLATLSTNFWWLTAALFISGLGVAPALTVLFTTVSATMKFSETAESFAWMSSGQLVGAGIGAAVAGIFIDQLGPASALYVAAGFAFITTLISLMAKPWAIDLRGRDLSPPSETGSIKVVG